MDRCDPFEPARSIVADEDDGPSSLRIGTMVGTMSGAGGCCRWLREVVFSVSVLELAETEPSVHPLGMLGLVSALLSRRAGAG